MSDRISAQDLPLLHPFLGQVDDVDDAIKLVIGSPRPTGSEASFKCRPGMSLENCRGRILLFDLVRSEDGALLVSNYVVGPHPIMATIARRRELLRKDENFRRQSFEATKGLGLRGLGPRPKDDDLIVASPELSFLANLLAPKPFAVAIDTESRREESGQDEPWALTEVGVVSAAGTNVVRLQFDAGTSCEWKDIARLALRRIGEWGSLVVGHRVEHDLDVLNTGMGLDLRGLCPLWDTLLIEYLLDPTKQSYSLDSDHRASTDAARAFHRLLMQWERIGWDVSSVRRLLSGVRFGGAGVIALVCDRLYSRRDDQVPAWVRPGPSGDLLVSSAALRGHDWTANLRWRDVDLAARKTRYVTAAADAGGSVDQRRLVLASVLDACRRWRVPVREDMIHPVVREPAAEFLQTTSPDGAVWQIESYLGCMRRLCAGPAGQTLPSALRERQATLEIIAGEPVIGQFRGASRRGQLNGPGASKQRCRRLEPRLLAADDLRDEGVEPVDGLIYWTEPKPDSNSDEWVLLAGPTLSTNPQSDQARAEVPSAARIPDVVDWVEADGESLLLWPTTGNRIELLLQTVRQALAVARDLGEGQALALVAPGDAEAEVLNRLLACGESDYRASQSEGTFRERVRRAARRKGGGGIVVLAEAAASIALRTLRDLDGVQVTVAVLRLPLERWELLLATPVDNEPTSAALAPTDPGVASDDEAPETDKREADERAVELLRTKRSGLSTVSAPSHGSAIAGAVLRDLVCARLEHLGAVDDLVHDVVVLDARWSLYAPRWSSGGAEGRRRIALTGEQATQAAAQSIGLESPRYGGVAPSDLESARTFLLRHWQSASDFRPHQIEPITEIMRNAADVVVRLRTGEGKSALFQIPALVRGLESGRLTICVSPLKALMYDQVEGMREKGFGDIVEMISSDLSPFDVERSLQRVADGQTRLLYVAPERFSSFRFRSVIERRYLRDEGFEYLVFDEAHCISEWGFDFRPDYLRCLRYVCEQFRGKGASTDRNHLIFLSATLTALAVERVLSRVQLAQGAAAPRRRCAVFPETIDSPWQDFIDARPEMARGPLFSQEEGSVEERVEAVVGALEAQSEHLIRKVSSAVVFVPRRRDAEIAATTMRKERGRLPVVGGIECFHAGVSATERLAVYESFRHRGVGLMTATCAFGMGVDVGHIHASVHLAPPRSLESVVQEIGRIGRDPSERAKLSTPRLQSVVLHHADDFDQLAGWNKQNEVSLGALDEVWRWIRQHAHQLSHQLIAMVPLESGLVSAGISESQLSRALFWLEECGRVTLERIVPAMLEVSVDAARLKVHAAGRGDDAKVAQCLLERVHRADGDVREDVTAATSPPDAARGVTSSDTRSGGWVRRILRSFVGFFVSPAAAPRDLGDRVTGRRSPVPTRRSGVISPPELLLQLDEVCRWSGLASIERTLDAILDLNRAGALKVTRRLRFRVPGSWESLSTAKDLLTALAATVARDGWSGTREDLRKFSVKLLEDRGASKDLLARAQAWSNSLLGLLLDQQLLALKETEDGESATPTRRFVRAGDVRPEHLIQRVKDILDVADAIFGAVQPAPVDGSTGDRQLTLDELVRRVAETTRSMPRVSRLKSSLRLLESLRLAECRSQLVPRAAVLWIRDSRELQVPTAGAPDTGDLPLRWLAEVGELGDLRLLAVQLWCVIRDPELRQRLVRAYFNAKSLDEIQTCLAQIAGELDSAELPESLRARLTTRRSELLAARFARELDPVEQLPLVKLPWKTSVLVEAGPGSGKTRVIVERCLELVGAQGLSPEHVLVLAFNRAVVHELRTRVRAALRSVGYGSYARKLRITTFHSFCKRIVHEQDAARALGGTTEERRRRDPEGFVRDAMDLLRREPGALRRECPTVVAVLVDEFQDVDDDRLELVSLFARDLGASITCVGDDDQDILEWNRRRSGSGSSPQRSDYFARIGELIPELCSGRLTTNYRSVQPIIDLAVATLESAGAADRRKRGVALRSARNVDGNPEADSAEEILARDPSVEANLPTVMSAMEAWRARGVRSVAVLTRTNAEALAWHQALESPFRAVRLSGADEPALDRLRQWWIWNWCLENRVKSARAARTVSIDDAVAAIDEMLAFKVKLADQFGFELLVRRLWDGLHQEAGAVTIPDLGEAMELLRESDLLLRWRIADARVESPTVVVSTIDKVKGLEFDAVVLVPSASYLSSPARIADDARKTYVGMTRARDHLLAFRPAASRERESRDDHGVRLSSDVDAPFCIEIGTEALQPNRSIRVAEKLLKLHVCEGDDVQLKDQEFVHCRTGESIACLNGSATDSLLPLLRCSEWEIRVQRVIRYFPSADPLPNPTRSGAHSWLDDARNQAGNIWKPNAEYPGWHFVPEFIAVRRRTATTRVPPA